MLTALIHLYKRKWTAVCLANEPVWIAGIKLDEAQKKTRTKQNVTMQKKQVWKSELTVWVTAELAVVGAALGARVVRLLDQSFRASWANTAPTKKRKERKKAMKPNGFSLVAKTVKCTWHPFLWARSSICRQPEVAALRQRQEALNPVRWDRGSAFGWIKFPLTWFQALLRCTKQGRVPRDTFPFHSFSLSPQLYLLAGRLKEMFYSSGPFWQTLLQEVTSQQQHHIESCNKSALELLPNHTIPTSLWKRVHILTQNVVCLQRFHSPLSVVGVWWCFTLTGSAFCLWDWRWQGLLVNTELRLHSSCCTGTSWCLQRGEMPGKLETHGRMCTLFFFFCNFATSLNFTNYVTFSAILWYLYMKISESYTCSHILRQIWQSKNPRNEKGLSISSLAERSAALPTG